MPTGARATDREVSLKLWVVLARCYQALSEQAGRDVVRHGLTPSEFAVLEVLFHKGDLPIGELGSRVLLTSGSMTYVVDKLEGRQLVVRRQCAEDRRVMFASLTAAGRRLMTSIFPGHAEVVRQATAGLDLDEKRLVTVLLKRLGLAARRHPVP